MCFHARGYIIDIDVRTLTLYDIRRRMWCQYTPHVIRGVSLNPQTYRGLLQREMPSQRKTGKMCGAELWGIAGGLSTVGEESGGGGGAVEGWGWGTRGATPV